MVRDTKIVIVYGDHKEIAESAVSMYKKSELPLRWVEPGSRPSARVEEGAP